MKRVNLLIVDDEESIRNLFMRLAEKEGWSCRAVKSGYEALDFLAKNEVECTVLDIHLPSCSGIEVLKSIKTLHHEVEVVVITSAGSVEQAVQAVKLDAFDYLTKPFNDLDIVTSILRHAIEKRRLLHQIRQLQVQEPLHSQLEKFEGLVGRSVSMQEIYRMILSIKGSDASVLIEGESGTGKEMVAQAIHRTSKRSARSFLVINCAAIPEGLLESELFGHMRGAFTGAVHDKRGLFEEADGGTIFLDEIGEVSPAFQVKLLRTLQNGEIRRIGSDEIRHVDVRIIAATNQDLRKMVKSGKFREDLYYRLHVIGIHLPALRERKEDIPLLAHYFLKKYAEKLKKNIREISFETLQALQNYSWTGNVRELENVIERCCVFANDEAIRVKDLPDHVLDGPIHPQEEEKIDLSCFPYREAKLKALKIFNKTYISHLLMQSGGNISVASGRAGMDRSNFRKILRRYHIDVKEFGKDH